MGQCSSGQSRAAAVGAPTLSEPMLAWVSAPPPLAEAAQPLPCGASQLQRWEAPLSCQGKLAVGSGSACGSCTRWGPAAAAIAIASCSRSRRVARRSRNRGGSIQQQLPGRPRVYPGGELELEFAERAEEALVKTDDREIKFADTKWNGKDWKYFDVANIYVRAGKGGFGCKSFCKQANEPFCGPDGGNGGPGGHVYLQCDTYSNDLMKLKYDVQQIAEDGRPGWSRNRAGKPGKDLVIGLPPGCCVYVMRKYEKGYTKRESPGREELVSHEDVKERVFVGELLEPGQMMRVARGGLGGRGNASYFGHKDTAPWIRQVGEEGMCRWISVELKLVADIGIVGAPNAGKSSLLTAVSNCPAKIAAYPFTTVVPNLGTYEHDVGAGLVLSDTCGLVAEASEGRGMGSKFLRHIERCRGLIHLVSGDSEDPIGDFETVQEELRKYSADVYAKPQVVVVNKCDIPAVKEKLPELMKELRKRCGHTRVFDISVATLYHVQPLMKRIWKWHQSLVKQDMLNAGASESDVAEALQIGSERRIMRTQNRALKPVVNKEVLLLDKEKDRRRGNGPHPRDIESRVEWDVLEQAWRLRHPEVERFANNQRWEWADAYVKFNKVLQTTGMSAKMKAVGVTDGEEVIVGTHKFSFYPYMAGEASRMLMYDGTFNDLPDGHLIAKGPVTEERLQPLVGGTP